ncbi:MAG TPA: MFS transporter [Dehalococcoidia bacterium]|nr:MFS transporter [Dehalococcoidia bacterium]
METVEQSSAPPRHGLAGRLLARQFSSLASYNYRLFFCGQVISLIGSYMQSTGQAWLVLKLTGSPAALGLVVTLQYLPVTLLSLLGGALADRLPKRPAIMALLALETVQATLLSLVVVTGVVQLWQIYALAAFLGVMNALERPVRQTFFVELVGRERLVNAVALNSTILNASQVIGPAIGGFVIAVFGIAATFEVNAVSFLAVLAGYALMRPAEFYEAKGRPQSRGVLRDIRDGLRYSFGTPGVLFILLLVGCTSLFAYNFSVMIPLIARFVLHTGAAGFGFLTASLGAGSLFAAFAIAGMPLRSARVLVVSGAAVAALTALLALSHAYLLTAALLVALGVATMALYTTANTTLQLTAPPALRGRVISIYVLLQTGTIPFGGAASGYLADRLGVSPTLAVQALLCAAGLGLALAYRLRRPEATPPVPYVTAGAAPGQPRRPGA